MRKSKSLLFLTAACAILVSSGCKIEDGKITLDDPVTPPAVAHSYTFDAVKLIAPEITRRDDPSSYLQDSYTVHAGRRVLLRLENLMTSVPRILTSGTSKIQVQIRVTKTSATNVTAAQADLQLCPMTRQWMMLSTWTAAHPFSSSGRWRHDGGDYDDSTCVRATKVEGDNLIFDMTQWFIDMPKGRSLNYGLILIGNLETTVHGENSLSYSPRMLWEEKQQ